MKHRLLAAPALVAVFGLAAAVAASAPSTMMNTHTATTATVNLTAQNKSGQSGTAMLSQEGANVVVTLTMAGIARGVAEPAHIHPGSCAKLNVSPKYPLTNATEGSTTTTLKNVQLASLMGGKYAINVHNPKHLSIYVACGNIK